MYVTGDESEKLQVTYVWEPDEWYYEGEWEAYKADVAAEKERKKLEAENDKEEQRKRRELLAKDHKRQLSSMPHMNLFEDENQDDGEYVSDDEKVDYYDYGNAHLYFSAKDDPKGVFRLTPVELSPFTRKYRSKSSLLMPSLFGDCNQHTTCGDQEKQ
ncbi:hypothetical protein CTI12_AA087490 [Artemisia annua]|uniref:Uncharacterized protein n=1 Tax=Artemisia annua TaxID=35608 RepID=A0A2U1PSI9_ARTAN|nr:hypothetical protein CTI12_AA087490 [Artemisia annua]